MEPLSSLKLCPTVTDGDGSGTDITESSFDSAIDGDETDDEDSFFDLELTVPCHNDSKRNDSANKNDELDRSEQRTKPQSPILLLRSPPNYPALMLFQDRKLHKTEAVATSPVSKHDFQEIPISSLFSTANSSSSNPSKRFTNNILSKYVKLMKPLYTKASKRYADKLRFSDKFLVSSPSSSPAIAPLRSPMSLKTPLRAVCRQLRKSRSASSAVGIFPPATVEKRDDSLVQQHDGIQSAILHCKSSYYSSRDPSRTSTGEVHGRNSI